MKKNKKYPLIPIISLSPFLHSIAALPLYVFALSVSVFCETIMAAPRKGRAHEGCRDHHQNHADHLVRH